MFSDGAAEKSAAFSYGDYLVGTRPAGLVINKRAGRRYMCFDLNEGVQEDFRPNPANSDDK